MGFAELLAFLLVISGWVLVSSTLPTDYWKVSTIDGTVITTATFWANLWKTCVTDSTGVSNCKDFPSMLALDGLHTRARALAPLHPSACSCAFGGQRQDWDRRESEAPIPCSLPWESVAIGQVFGKACGMVPRRNYGLPHLSFLQTPTSFPYHIDLTRSLTDVDLMQRWKQQ
uniref:Uncharacterized protein n=1 Tax=Sphaerodactylus townsendi TaxID=933632 RepID=A0ACB8FJH8_9SAUR